MSVCVKEREGVNVCVCVCVCYVYVSEWVWVWVSVPRFWSCHPAACERWYAEGLVGGIRMCPKLVNLLGNAFRAGQAGLGGDAAGDERRSPLSASALLRQQTAMCRMPSPTSIFGLLMGSPSSRPGPPAPLEAIHWG